MAKRRRKKKNKLLSALLTLAIISVVSFGGYQTWQTNTKAGGQNVTVEIDGKAVSFNDQVGRPYIDGASRTQVPLNAAMTAFGAQVTWDDSIKTATVKKDNTTVKVPVGKHYILVNGAKQTIDTEAKIVHDRTYLPIAHVLCAFGATVGWDADAYRVIVMTGHVVTVHFIDVGQGDATLIDNGQTEILIDAGNNKDGKKVVDYIKPYVDGKLDYVVATHPDADHIGGLDDVLKAYDVGRIIDSGDKKSSATYREYYEAAMAEKGCQFTYDEDETIPLADGVNFRVIETGDNYKDSNDNSVVTMLVYKDVSVLFTGDMESQAEKASLSKFSDVDVLKAGHHGSKTSSSAAFLSVVKPEYVVVSSGKNNKYGHPSAAALQRFFNCGAKVYGTYKSGNVVMMTNGTVYDFNTSKTLSMLDAGSKQ